MAIKKPYSPKAKPTRMGRMHVKSIYDRVDDNSKDVAKNKREIKQNTQQHVDQRKTQSEVKVKGASTGYLDVFQPNGFYHAVELGFALGRHPSTYYGDEVTGYGNSPSPVYTDEELENWGTAFGNPLVNPKSDCIYIVRAKVDQLRADPMIGGFKLHWRWPNGWSPVDSVPRRQLVECSSNPLYVQRLFKSPSGTVPNGGAFRCNIVAWYP